MAGWLEGSLLLPAPLAILATGLVCNAVIGSFLLAERDDIRLAAGGSLGRAVTRP